MSYALEQVERLISHAIANKVVHNLAWTPLFFLYQWFKRHRFVDSRIPIPPSCIQFWQYQVGQEKSACHFPKKKLTVTLLVKHSRGVRGECILTFGMSYVVILRTLKCNLCQKFAKNYHCSSTGIFSINSYSNQTYTYKGCIETARKSRFWFLVNFSLFWLLQR